MRASDEDEHGPRRSAQTPAYGDGSRDTDDITRKRHIELDGGEQRGKHDSVGGGPAMGTWALEATPDRTVPVAARREYGVTRVAGSCVSPRTSGSHVCAATPGSASASARAAALAAKNPTMGLSVR
jgi:hypothetical protein